MTSAPILSQTELESLCSKAARGAGLAWGLAEEAGKAAGWLYTHGIDGAAALLGALTPAPGGAPQCGGADWSGPGPLCPIMTGAALADFAPLGALPRRILDLRCPVLVLPFLARAAGWASCQFYIRCANQALTVTPDGILGSQSSIRRLAVIELANLDIRSAPAAVQSAHSPEFAVVDVPSIAALDALGARTYVPATENSRLSGAGAGTSDND